MRSRVSRGGWAVAGLVLLATNAVGAQGQTGAPDVAGPSAGVFYQGRPFGTEAYMGPLGVLLNKGFAVTQFRNRSRFIFDYPYAWGHVSKSITHLSANVERFGGWGEFLGKELIPTSTGPDDWKWWPNYFGHALEGGITYRRLAEWNRAHGVPLPRLTAGILTMGAAVINEAYSHPGQTEGSAATSADLLLFDPLGIVLFSFDRVAEFFAGPLNASIWTGQAALTLEGELVNNGSSLIVKLPVLPFAKTSFFFRGGLVFTPGITFHRDDGLDVSLAMGGEGRTQDIDPVTGEETPGKAFGGGVFIDREGSLLMSAVVSEAEHRRLIANVFPGVFQFGGGRFGGWFLFRDDWSFRFGISMAGALGLGPAAGIGG